VDLNLPADHRDLLHHQAKQALALLEAEFFDALSNSLGKRRHSSAQAIVAAELPTLGGERVVFLFEPATASCELAVTTPELREIDHPDLVEIDESTPFEVGLVESSSEPLQLPFEQLIIGHRLASEHSPFPGQEQIGMQESLPNLLPHERIELIGSNGGLPTAAFRPSRTKRVTIVAGVVEVVAAPAGRGAVAAGLDSATTADHQATQQPGPGR